ncbi:MAG: hypothetical protein H7039_05015 [Bryobacteraceae bacterium]|nr:hypothetical protein [Bryobacteraceae bacterium]
MSDFEKDQFIYELQRSFRELQRRHGLLEFRLQQLEVRINRIAERTGIGEECTARKVAGLTDAQLRDWISVAEEHMSQSPRRN